MSYLINNEQKLNDIIFADRNKEYGAYVIRSSYGNTIFKSLTCMLSGVIATMSLAYFLTHRNNDPEESGLITTPDSAIVVIVNIPEIDEPVAAAERNDPPPPATEKTDPAASISTVIADAAIESTVSAIIEQPVVNNTTTIAGTGSTSIPGLSVTGVGGVSGGVSDTAVVDPFKLDSQPIYEGGPAALRQFVAEHLKYPHWASEEGRDGTVYVKFVVDENGKVGRLTLQNTIGYGMDDEAIRVVSLIPKFKSPAMIKGIPVKAYYQIPIRFRFNN